MEQSEKDKLHRVDVWMKVTSLTIVSVTAIAVLSVIGKLDTYLDLKIQEIKAAEWEEKTDRLREALVEGGEVHLDDGEVTDVTIDSFRIISK